MRDWGIDVRVPCALLLSAALGVFTAEAAFAQPVAVNRVSNPCRGAILWQRSTVCTHSLKQKPGCSNLIATPYRSEPMRLCLRRQLTPLQGLTCSETRREPVEPVGIDLAAAQLVDPAVAYPPDAQPQFTLETDIYLDQQKDGRDCERPARHG